MFSLCAPTVRYAPPVTEQVPSHSKILFTKMARASGGANNMRSLSWGVTNGKKSFFVTFLNLIFNFLRWEIFEGKIFHVSSYFAAFLLFSKKRIWLLHAYLLTIFYFQCINKTYCSKKGFVEQRLLFFKPTKMQFFSLQ